MKPEEYVSKLERMRSYRSKVRSLVSSIIENNSISLVLPIDPSSIWWILLMGLEHSRIHIETSMAILTQMPLEHLKVQMGSEVAFPVADYSTNRCQVRQNTLVRVSGGKVRAGRPLRGTEYYGWDNEFGTGEEVNLTDFEVCKRMKQPYCSHLQSFN